VSKWISAIVVWLATLRRGVISRAYSAAVTIDILLNCRGLVTVSIVLVRYVRQTYVVDCVGVCRRHC
jgi:hypothetical protein